MPPRDQVKSQRASERRGAAVPGLRSDEGATREGGAKKRPVASEPGGTASKQESTAKKRPVASEPGGTASEQESRVAGDPELRREQMLRAAVEVIIERGFADTRIADVA